MAKNRLNLILAGLNFEVKVDRYGEWIIPILKGLFGGFVTESQQPSTSIRISFLRCDREIRFSDTEIISYTRQKIKGMDTSNFEQVCNLLDIIIMPQDILLAGYKDGCLMYDQSSSEAKVLLFISNKKCDLIWSVNKLLFLFFALTLSEKRGCFIHAAGVEKDGKGYLFLGSSGAGKTTIANLIKGRKLLSDDSPILMQEDGHFSIYTSPYCQVNLLGKEKKFCRDMAELNHVYVLKKDRFNHLKEADKKVVFSDLIKYHIHLLRCITRRGKENVFNLCFDFCQRLPIHELHFGLKESPWQTIKRGKVDVIQ